MQELCSNLTGSTHALTLIERRTTKHSPYCSRIFQNFIEHDTVSESVVFATPNKPRLRRSEHCSHFYTNQFSVDAAAQSAF